MENTRLRKEISELFAVLHAVRECCEGLGLDDNDNANDGVPRIANDVVAFENIFLIDLCCGKGITTMLCGAMDAANEIVRGGGSSNNHFLAIDKLMPHAMPHFANDGRTQYLRRDIMSDGMFDEISDIVRGQTITHGRSCILVGMHLCGTLSERAIDIFHRTPEVRGIVLSPCCLPKRHELSMMSFEKSRPGGEASSANPESHNYLRWANYLVERIAGRYSVGGGEGVADVRLYTDEEMHTEKNAIVVGLRK